MFQLELPTVIFSRRLRRRWARHACRRADHRVVSVAATTHSLIRISMIITSANSSPWIRWWPPELRGYGRVLGYGWKCSLTLMASVCFWVHVKKLPSFTLSLVTLALLCGGNGKASKRKATRECWKSTVGEEEWHKCSCTPPPRCTPRARMLSNVALFVNLTPCCYRHLCIEMKQNMPFPAGRTQKNFLGRTQFRGEAVCTLSVTFSVTHLRRWLMTEKGHHNIRQQRKRGSDQRSTRLAGLWNPWTSQYSTCCGHWRH